MKKRIIMAAATAGILSATLISTSAFASETNVVNKSALQSNGLVSSGALKVQDPSKGWDVNIQSSDFGKLGADINTLADAINSLGTSTSGDIAQLKSQIDTDLTTKLEDVNSNIANEKAVREAADNAIYKILGISGDSEEKDENGNAIERDNDGNITRVIKTETTVNGTVITVTRYDVSKDPAEKIDEVSFDTATGKAVTKEGTVVDPIIEQNTPAQGQTTVTVINNDKTKTTIVYTNDTTVADIEKYIKEHFGFTDSQLADMRKLIEDAINAGASSQQDIINYVTNHTVSRAELNALLDAINAPSTDGEIGVTMDEVKAYLESKIPAPSTTEINNIINKYLTMAGLTQEEVEAIINAMNTPAADTNNDGLLTKAELEAYLSSLTNGQGDPLYSAEEVAKLAAAYINIPTTTEINNYYKVFDTTEVNNISTAVTQTYDDTALRTQIQNVSDTQLSILDKLAMEERARAEARNNLSTDVDGRINSLSTDVDNRLNTLNNTVNNDLKNYINHGGTDTEYSGVRAKYTPKTSTTPATVTFSPIPTSSNSNP